MMRHAWPVLRKELREIGRDRRSLLSGLFYGVWGPLVMGLALTATAREADPRATVMLPVQGAHHAASLMAFLRERHVAVVPATEALEDGIRRRRQPVALTIADDYAASFSDAKPASLTLLFDGSWSTSKRQADRVRALLSEYSRQTADTRLIMRGVSPRAVAPLDIAERDFSTPASRAAGAMATLPLFVLLAAFVGGMSIAADVTSGERERGTLEALLVAPASRLALVAGKWLATALAALVTVAVALLVSQIVLRHPRVASIDLPVGLSQDEALRMWLLLAPLALLVAALQVAIGLVARTFKEAQTHLSLLMFVPMVPGFLLAFGAVPQAAWMAWTPLVGQHLAIAAIVGGTPLTPGTLVGLQALTLGLTIMALITAGIVMSREGILRRIGG
jgi:sodium transport system permease protein